MPRSPWPVTMLVGDYLDYESCGWAPPTVGSIIPRQVNLSFMRKQSDHEPVISAPFWFLPWLISNVDCYPLLSQMALCQECFIRATGKQSRTTTHSHGCSVVTSDHCLEEAAHIVTPLCSWFFPVASASRLIHTVTCISPTSLSGTQRLFHG